jgi:hypothetical protein
MQLAKVMDLMMISLMRKVLRLMIVMMMQMVMIIMKMVTDHIGCLCSEKCNAD